MQGVVIGRLSEKIGGRIRWRINGRFVDVTTTSIGF